LALSAKKKDINTRKKILASLEFDFFRVQLKFAFRIWPLVLCFYCNCVCISLRDLSSSTLLAVLVTYLHMYIWKK